MAGFRCEVCDYLYDEQAEGVPWSDLPDDWVCPVPHPLGEIYYFTCCVNNSSRLNISSHYYLLEINTAD